MSVCERLVASGSVWERLGASGSVWERMGGSAHHRSSPRSRARCRGAAGADGARPPCCRHPRPRPPPPRRRATGCPHPRAMSPAAQTHSQHITPRKAINSERQNRTRKGKLSIRKRYRSNTVLRFDIWEKNLSVNTCRTHMTGVSGRRQYGSGNVDILKFWM